MPVSACVGAEGVVVAAVVEVVVAVEDVSLVGIAVAPRTAGGRGQSLLNTLCSFAFLLLHINIITLYIG